MQATFKTAELLRAVSSCAPLAAGTKANIKPVLRNILLRADPVSTTLQTTNLEAGISVSILPLLRSSPADILLPAADLLRILRVAKGDQFDISLDDRGVVHLSSAAAKWRLPTADAKGFPQIPLFPESAPSLTCDPSLLSSAIAQARAAMGENHTQAFATRGILLAPSVEKKTIELKSTDGHIGVISKIPAEVSSNGNAFIPEDYVKSFAEILSGDSCSMKISERDIHVQSGSSSLYSRQLQGRFPPIETLVPKKTATSFTINVGAMREVISIAAAASSDKEESLHVAVSVSDSSLEIRLESSLGFYGRAECPITSFSGKPVELWTQHRWLSRLLSSFEDTADIQVGIVDSESAFKFTHGGTWIGICMPTDPPGSRKK